MLRDPGRALVLLAMVLAAALYAPSLGNDFVGSDDNWLVRDNPEVRDLDAAKLKTIFFELAVEKRMVIGTEYLPIRDLSTAADFAVWGTWWPGHHLTNLLLYLATIALWFGALTALGVDRVVAGLAMLVWAVHPEHAESVSWLAERKGLLALALVGVVALAFARFRNGRSPAWLVLACVTTVLAVWSKAHAAFAVAALGPLAYLLPGDKRRAWIGLSAIGAVCALAFVPVILTIFHAGILGAQPTGSKAALVVGAHGFYVRLALMAMTNAYSYPFLTDGPSTLDLVLGALGLAVALVGLLPRWPRPVRAGAALWLVGWLPVGHLLFHNTMIPVADRYLYVSSLGFALAVGYGLSRIPRLRALAVAAVVIAAGARTLVAASNWRDAQSLWSSAVASNPDDGDAWSAWAENADDPDAVVAAGLAHTRAPRLVMRAAMRTLAHGDRAGAEALMREAAKGEPRAIGNLALMRLEDGDLQEALVLGSRAAAAAPMYAPAQRARGKIELAAGHPEEALVAFDRAYALEPNLPNRFNLGLALLQLGRRDEAVPHFEACLGDPVLGPRAAAALHK